MEGSKDGLDHVGGGARDGGYDLVSIGLRREDAGTRVECGHTCWA